MGEVVKGYLSSSSFFGEFLDWLSCPTGSIPEKKNEPLYASSSPPSKGAPAGSGKKTFL
jgi:hypothetical protein